MSSTSRALIDSIAIFIFISILFAAFYISVYEARKYRAKIKENQKKLSSPLAIRCLSFVLVLGILSALSIPVYYVGKIGIPLLDMNHILSLHYGDSGLIALLCFIYRIVGAFLITVSFIFGFIYLVVLIFSIRYFFIKPDTKNINSGDEEDDDIDEEDEEGYKEI